MLRITGGVFQGRSLVTPKQIRATATKVRQALYNILGSFVEGARVVDGFAGSGALGCEALSRGAAFVAFVESDTEAVLSIRENIERLGFDVQRGAWRVVHLDIERGLRQLAHAEPPFDLILLDPPYRTGEGKKALNAVVEYAMLAPAGMVVIEHDRRTELPPDVGPLQRWKQHRYGDTVLSFYRAGHT
jgi:16S rRNA (guanine(966)-N(2))-methyltransferase RsmD